MKFTLRSIVILALSVVGLLLSPMLKECDILMSAWDHLKNKEPA